MEERIVTLPSVARFNILRPSRDMKRVIRIFYECLSSVAERVIMEQCDTV